MRDELLVALVVVLLAVALAGGYFMGVGNNGRPTVSTTTTTVVGPTIFSRTTTTISGTTTVTPGVPIPVTEIETGNVSVGGYTMAVNPGAGRVYVAGTSNILTVIDAYSHAVVAKITLPNSSNAGIAIDYRTGTVYVLVQGGIAVVNSTSNSVVREIQADFGFRSIAFDEATDTIYGSPETALFQAVGSLVGISAQTGAVTQNVSIGYWANDIEVNPKINMIYAVGCNQMGLVCDSVATTVNGTTGTIVRVARLGSAYYATATIDEKTGFVYISGESQLVALDSLGNVAFTSYPDTCGPFIGMATDPAPNQVIMAPQNYNFLLVYDGEYGNLLNMYSLPSAPQYVAFNPNTNETYALLSGSLLSFKVIAGTGHVNGTLIGEDQFCNPP